MSRQNVQNYLTLVLILYIIMIIINNVYIIMIIMNNVYIIMIIINNVYFWNYQPIFKV